jgi:hypothetical protein
MVYGLRQLKNKSRDNCEWVKNEHVSWKEDPQLPQVRLLKLQSFLSESPHAGSQWGEAICLQKVQLLLHTSW